MTADIAAIARECLGGAMIEDVRSQLLLPGPPIGAEQAPEHLLIILFASRAGSTYAGQLLSRTRHFKRVGEFFNVRQLRQIRERQGFADDIESLRWAIGEFGSPHAFGAKCGIPGLAGAHLTGFLEAAFPRISFVLLDRRDRVAQAVSLFRADLTGRFQSSQQARRPISAGDYDREAIAKRLAVIEHVYEIFAGFLDRAQKRFPTFWYEDVAEDPSGFVDSVCEEMGLDRPRTLDTDIRATKLADDISAEWIARFRAGG